MYINVPIVMTRKECQEILHISKHSMLELIHSGKIDSFTVKGKFMITREALSDFIRNSQYMP